MVRHADNNPFILFCYLRTFHKKLISFEFCWISIEIIIHVVINFLKNEKSLRQVISATNNLTSTKLKPNMHLNYFLHTSPHWTKNEEKIRIKAMKMKRSTRGKKTTTRRSKTTAAPITRAARSTAGEKVEIKKKTESRKRKSKQDRHRGKEGER